MKLIIDISEDVRTAILEMGLLRIPQEMQKTVDKALQKGTPLPKGCGDLIDKSKIYKAIYAEEDNCTGMGMSYEEMDAYNEGVDAMYFIVKGAPVIIKGETE